MSAARIRALDWAPLAVAVACALVFFAELVPFARLWMDEHHDGLMFKNALDVYAGQIPYRDSYNQYGFLPSVLAAGAMKLFGPALLTLKLAAVAAYAVAAGAMTLAWRRAIPLAGAAAAGLIWIASQPEVSSSSLVFLPWPSIYALAFIGAATVAHLRSLEGGERAIGWGALAGACAVATGCCRLSVGLLLAIAILVSYFTRAVLLGERSRAAALGFAAATAAGVALVAAVFLALGGLGAMIDQTWVQPRAYLERVSPARFFPAILLPALAWLALVAGACLALRWALAAVEGRWGAAAARRAGIAIAISLPAVGLILTQTRSVTVPMASWWPDDIVVWEPAWISWAAIWTAAGMLSVAIAAVAVVTAAGNLALGTRPVRRPVPGAVISLAIIGAAGIAQFYPVFEPRHMHWACVPALGLVVWFMLRVAGPRPLAGIAVLLLVTAIPAAESIRGAEAKLEVPSGSIPRFRALDGIVQLPSAEARRPLLEALRREYARRPDAPMLNISQDAMWGSLGTNMDNPDAYFVTWPCPLDPSAQARFIADERPLLWWEGGTPDQIAEYGRSIGYRIVARATPESSWRLPTYLLVPGRAAPRPPYVWTVAALPPPPWATVQGAPPPATPAGCPAPG